MITLYDILEAASIGVEGTFILHRSMTVHPIFKVYKIFRYDLYYMCDGEKRLMLTFETKENCPADMIDSIWDKCDRIYLDELMKWLTGDNYKILRDGVQ